ncbi:hypothetical protein C1646_748834 [Rhizophagus diaphanus]|nr:hypothetical protein C1646_748834 [Rhizophagus diaphanus] [Rhizophagus sp. MUCL 43196]
MQSRFDLLKQYVVYQEVRSANFWMFSKRDFKGIELLILWSFFGKHKKGSLFGKREKGLPIFLVWETGKRNASNDRTEMHNSSFESSTAAFWMAHGQVCRFRRFLSGILKSTGFVYNGLQILSKMVYRVSGIGLQGSRMVQPTLRFRVLENGLVIQMSSKERKKPSFVSFGWTSDLQKNPKICSGGFLKNRKPRFVWEGF